MKPVYVPHWLRLVDFDAKCRFEHATKPGVVAPEFNLAA
jgi:hypothetical protein